MPKYDYFPMNELNSSDLPFLLELETTLNSGHFRLLPLGALLPSEARWVGGKVNYVTSKIERDESDPWYPSVQSGML